MGRVRFSPDGKCLAVGVDNGTYLYDVKRVGQLLLFQFGDVNRLS